MAAQPIARAPGEQGAAPLQRRIADAEKKEYAGFFRPGGDQMATYTASAILSAPVTGTTLSGNTATITNFDPTADVLNFDNSGSMLAVSANRIPFFWSGQTLTLSYFGKSVALNMSQYYSNNSGLNSSNPPPIQLITTSNVTFWNGTQFLAGDNTFGGPITAGNDTMSGQSLTGTDVAYPTSVNAGDQFVIFGANATMNGGAGDDLFDFFGPANPEGILQTAQING